jgi:uncharacterized protein (TIGR03435 family)
VKLRTAALAIWFLIGSLQAQTFDVASVKPGKGDGRSTTNVPLGPGELFQPTGGLFTATGQTVFTYIAFAYKLAGNQIQFLQPQLPSWAMTDPFDVQARANPTDGGNPGKDQMRMMMRGLLADRFKLAIHNETRQLPVLAMVLVKPGTPGPQLIPHPANTTCSTTPSGSATETMHTPAGDLPLMCNGIFPMNPSAPRRLRFAGRKVTIGFIGDSLSAGAGLGRPMIDQTGLFGTFDFILEFTPENRNVPPAVADADFDSYALSFQDAFRTQLGIKLVAQKGPVSVMVVDHLERPSAN